MNIWAIADLHLAKAVAAKSMEVFGPTWTGYMEKIEKNWQKVVAKEDLVLLPGDISWAMKLEEALPDLAWIDALPGTKVMIKGNHDYWWSSASKVRSLLPPSLHIIQNDSFTFHDISIGGTRLWDSEEYFFSPTPPAYSEEDRKIFARELHRLELSLQSLSTEKRIVMTHYPPIGANLDPSSVSKLLEKYRVSFALFGHLHGKKPHSLPFGEKNGVRYFLTAADYLEFTPILIKKNNSDYKREA